MKTSYFGITPRKTPGAIAISLYLPKGRQYLHYPKLAPSQELLQTYRDPNAAIIYHSIQKWYAFEYFDQLFLLNPQQVWDELHELAGDAEPTLLCYEKPGQFCHRRLVAKWFEVELGEFVDEVSNAI